ncbi:MAG: type II toxin-antitoxin system VapC family toxin [Cytophagales bacterium]
MRKLVDRNIIIYFLEKSYPSHLEDFFQNLFVVGNKYSSILKIEALSLSKLWQTKISLVFDFFDQGKEYILSNEAILKAAEIRRNFKIKLPDAVIAATAIMHKFKFVTRNEKDFINIPDLSIENRFQPI